MNCSWLAGPGFTVYSQHLTLILCWKRNYIEKIMGIVESTNIQKKLKKNCRLFLQSPANPDLLYIIFFCHTQLTVTLLLVLIFGSKVSKFEIIVFNKHENRWWKLLVSITNDSKNARCHHRTKSNRCGFDVVDVASCVFIIILNKKKLNLITYWMLSCPFDKRSSSKRNVVHFSGMPWKFD